MTFSKDNVQKNRSDKYLSSNGNKSLATQQTIKIARHLTVPKKNASISISFFAYKLSLRESLLFLCRQKRVQYFGN